jgi:hypothetical protein
MKKITYLAFIFLSVILFNSCESKDDDSIPEISEVNYVSFESAEYAFGVTPGGSDTRDIAVFTSTTTSSDRTFNIQASDGSTLDPLAYSLPTSITIPANTNEGAISVTIDDVNIDEDDGETLIIEFASNDAGLFTSPEITLNVALVCPFNKVVLSIVFDDYPGETSWDIKDATNAIIASGDAGEGKWCLPDGNYTFTIYDVYSDGICCNYGNGSYTLGNGAGTTYATGGSFGSSETTAFTLGN